MLLKGQLSFTRPSPESFRCCSLLSRFLVQALGTAWPSGSWTTMSLFPRWKWAPKCPNLLVEVLPPALTQRGLLTQLAPVAPRPLPGHPGDCTESTPGPVLAFSDSSTSKWWPDSLTVKCLLTDTWANEMAKCKLFPVTLLSHRNSPPWLLPFIKLPHKQHSHFLNLVSYCCISLDICQEWLDEGECISLNTRWTYLLPRIVFKWNFVVNLFCDHYYFICIFQCLEFL